MSLLLTALFALSPGSATAQESAYLDRTVHAAGDLVGWCRSEAEARYAARGMSTYQWTASHVERGNTLHVEGRLRAEGQDIEVRCRIARGAQLRYASIDIVDPRLD